MSITTRRFFTLLCLTLLLLAGPLASQQQPNISVDVKLVNVLATVRNKHGDIVRTLTKDDFHLEEDGRAQTIQYFSKDSNLPLTLGLLVDTSMSQRQVLGDERTASYTFFDHVLRESDKAFVIHFDREVELLQDLTSSREKLQSSLQLLDSTKDDGGGYGGGQGGNGGPGGRGGHGAHSFGGAGTLLYDSIYLASNEVMKNQQGRKAMVILTDGVDHGSKESIVTAIESAQRADALVYSIYFTGEEGGGFNRGGGFGGPRLGGGPLGGGGRHRFPQEERPDGKKILERISQETGGHFFEVTKKLPVDQIYSEIEQELRNQYSLGFTPDNFEASYHKIHLTTKQSELIVQARDGFYGSH
jgi:VWFA-related protein